MARLHRGIKKQVLVDSKDPTPNHGLRRAAARPAPSHAATCRGTRRLLVRDDGLANGRVAARVGQPVTCAIRGFAPHTVTVANGPLGFSSLYSGLARGTYTFTPRRRATTA